MMPQILNHQKPSEYCSCGELHRCMATGNGYFLQGTCTYKLGILITDFAIHDNSQLFFVNRLGPIFYCLPPKHIRHTPPPKKKKNKINKINKKNKKNK